MLSDIEMESRITDYASMCTNINEQSQPSEHNDMYFSTQGVALQQSLPSTLGHDSKMALPTNLKQLYLRSPPSSPTPSHPDQTINNMQGNSSQLQNSIGRSLFLTNCMSEGKSFSTPLMNSDAGSKQRLFVFGNNRANSQADALTLPMNIPMQQLQNQAVLEGYRTATPLSIVRQLTGENSSSFDLQTSLSDIHESQNQQQQQQQLQTDCKQQLRFNSSTDSMHKGSPAQGFLPYMPHANQLSPMISSIDNNANNVQSNAFVGLPPSPSQRFGETKLNGLQDYLIQNSSLMSSPQRSRPTIGNQNYSMNGNGMDGLVHEEMYPWTLNMSGEEQLSVPLGTPPAQNDMRLGSGFSFSNGTQQRDLFQTINGSMNSSRSMGSPFATGSESNGHSLDMTSMDQYHNIGLQSDQSPRKDDSASTSSNFPSLGMQNQVGGGVDSSLVRPITHSALMKLRSMRQGRRTKAVPGQQRHSCGSPATCPFENCKLETQRMLLLECHRMAEELIREASDFSVGNPQLLDSQDMCELEEIAAELSSAIKKGCGSLRVDLARVSKELRAKVVFFRQRKLLASGRQYGMGDGDNKDGSDEYGILDKPWCCTWCPQRFTRKYEKIRHERVKHMNIRPYICDDCGKTFARTDALQRHKIIEDKAREKRQ